MGKKFIYILLCSGCLLTASCSFLDENLNGKYSEEDVYGSEAALESAIYGCYARLRTSAGLTSSSIHEFLYPASGIVHFGGPKSRLSDGQQRWTMMLAFTQYSTSVQGYNTFKNFYTAIYLCNKLIDNLPTSPVAADFKNQIEGEARFLRAVEYFYLVRQYGNIPYYSKPATSMSEADGPRVNFWEVYANIINDLEFAEENVRTYDEQYALNAVSSGRICRNAATAVKSLVYLTIGTLLAHPDNNFWVNVTPDFSQIGISSAEDAFKKALACAKDVLDETKSPYRLETNFANLFKWTDLADFESKERIFVIPSTSEVDGSALAGYTLPIYYNDTPSYSNYGRVRPSRWFFQKWCETYNGTLGSGDASNIYVKCEDPRLDVSLIHTSYKAKGGDPAYCYPNASSIYITSNEYKLCMPYYKKYYDPKYSATIGYADLYVMRLAEVYLIAAEAAANLNELQDAVGYVNVVLTRARNSTSTGIPAAEPANIELAEFATKEELINRIFWERCFELCGEGHEYFDTHRMGAEWLAENIAKPHNAFLYEPEQEDFTKNTQKYDGYRSTHFGSPKYGEKQIYPESVELVRKGLICAFPKNELTYNTSMTLDDQNPQEVFWQ